MMRPAFCLVWKQVKQSVNGWTNESAASIGNRSLKAADQSVMTSRSSIRKIASLIFMWCLFRSEAVGKRLDERIGGLDWKSLTQSGGPVSHDVEIFYPQNRFINFYVVPLLIEQREPTLAGSADSTARGVTIAYASGPRSTPAGPPEEVGHVMILRDTTESRRTAQQTIESERLNALRLLAAGVAHEIGNPLNSLHIHLQLMERSVQKLRDGEKKELQESIDVARSEVSRLDSIVTQFLKAIRPSPPQLRPESVNT